MDPPCSEEEKKPAAAENDEEEEEEEREEETEMEEERRLCRWYIHFLTLEKRSCKISIVVQDYLQLFRKRRSRRRRRYGGGEGGAGGKDDGGGLHTGSALFFGRRCIGARENKHRKDRNCFSERFDSRQMNLLKYTRNSTSRQYLHGRGGRIYIRAGCTAPFKPPSVSTTRR